MSEVAVVARLSGVEPSPQFTTRLEIFEPETEKVIVTVAPVLAGFGVRVFIVTVGAFGL